MLLDLHENITALLVTCTGASIVLRVPRTHAYKIWILRRPGTSSTHHHQKMIFSGRAFDGKDPARIQELENSDFLMRPLLILTWPWSPVYSAVRVELYCPRFYDHVPFTCRLSFAHQHQLPQYEGIHIAQHPII